VRRNHPVQANDAQCAVCHPPDANGITPISVAHEVTQQTRDPGMQLTDVTITGGTGAGGTLQIGDVPVLGFKLLDNVGAPISTLKTDSTLSGTLIIAGPTSAPQLLYASITMKSTGSLTYDSTSGRYTYTLAAPIPAQRLAPLNTTLATTPTDPGTYSFWFYINKSATFDGVSTRFAVNSIQNVNIGTTAPVRPRQVITDAACNACHERVQAHGGGRQHAAGCSNCHTQGAVDRTVGARGAACTSNAQCAGFAAGWEECRDTNNDATLDTCLVITDPTPNMTIDFRQMVHNIHFARLRGAPTTYVGNRNTLQDLSEILLPVDARSCTSCHANTAVACSSSNPCGYGQACLGGKCVNDAWKQPSTAVCLSCHSTPAAQGHAALNTWGQVETCEVCHGPGSQFSVETSHNLADPLVLPYPRE
jgi:hypothetical protein